MKTQFFKSKSGPIAFFDTNTPKNPMVFIHGFPTSKEMFLPLIKQFKDEYRIIGLDLHNYGESGRVTRHLEMKERVEEVFDFATSLQLENITVVGHDCGSSVAVGMMEKHPELIAKLILMNSPVYPDFPVPAVVQLFRSPVLGFIFLALFKMIILGESIKQGLVHKEMYATYLNSSVQKSYRGLTGTRALYREFRWGNPTSVFSGYPAIMRSITVPTLILHGRHDPYIPLGHAMRMHEDIPNSKLKIIENGSHFLPIDTPAEVVCAIRKFISVDKKSIAESARGTGPYHLKVAAAA